jgi:hypothetical protein
MAVDPAETYAAIWREPDGRIAHGKLLLGPDGLSLEGTTSEGALSRRRLGYEDVVEVRIGRAPEERLNGRPALVLERASGESIGLDVLGAGMLFELADVLANVTTERREALDRVVVVAPLRKGSLEKARALVAAGPPFDPAEKGFVRHEVFFTDTEAVFLFEGPAAGKVVQRLARDPATWRAAGEWRRLLAGTPRLARSGYTWARPIAGM